MNAIETRALSAGYKDRLVLKDIDIVIRKGKLTAIAGPNGSGKSTLLRTLIREKARNSGEISVLGKDIDSFSPRSLAQMIAFTPQAEQLDVDFTVEEFVALGRYPSSDVDNLDKVIEALSIAGIKELGARRISSLSGGEKQLSSIARAICQESEILLLDEPVSSLDPKHQKRILELLSDLVSRGKSVAAVLHSLDTILSYADDCILLKDGRVFSQGDAAEVLTEENLKSVFEIECTIAAVKGRKVVLF